MRRNSAQLEDSVFGTDPQNLTLAYENNLSLKTARDCGIEHNDERVFAEIDEVGKPVMVLDINLPFYV